jgi:hypothetical protein
VLDNFEHVLTAAAQVADLLSACPRVKILVTSREALRLRGERQFSVPPLALPDRSGAESADQLTRYEAIRLFIERAQAAKPGLDISNRNAYAIAAGALQPRVGIGAGDRNRTGDIQLGNFLTVVSRILTSYQSSSLAVGILPPESHALSLLLTGLGQQAPPAASCRHHSYVPRADGALDRTGLPAIVLWSIPVRFSQRTPVHEPPRTPSPCR